MSRWRGRESFRSGCLCGRVGLCLRFPALYVSKVNFPFQSACTAFTALKSENVGARRAIQGGKLTLAAIAIHLLTNIPVSASLVVIMPNLFACANLTNASTFSWREMSSSVFLDLYGSTAGAPEEVVFVPGLDILAGEVDMEWCCGVNLVCGKVVVNQRKLKWWMGLFMGVR